jgi:hypothetical protein
MTEDRTKKLQEKVKVFNRLLIIQSHVEDYYQVDCLREGNDRPTSKNKKYTNVLYLGMVLITYTKMFGRLQAPTAYTAYAQLCNRERTTAHHWMRLTRNMLDIYPKMKDEYQKFVDENYLNIYKKYTLDEKKMEGVEQ